MSAPSGDSFEGEDASGHSPSDGHEPAAQSSGSSAAPASAKQLAPGPSLDVIREDEEHGHRRLSPGDSLDSIEVCTLEVCGTGHWQELVLTATRLPQSAFLTSR